MYKNVSSVSIRWRNLKTITRTLVILVQVNTSDSTPERDYVRKILILNILNKIWSNSTRYFKQFTQYYANNIKINKKQFHKDEMFPLVTITSFAKENIHCHS